jgi:hypothetical protein
MITLEGLSKQQKALAQRLWELDTMDEVLDFIGRMPKRSRHQARVVFELMVAAQADQIMDVDLAKEVIDSVRYR